MFKGSIVALVTPMTSSGELDLKRLPELIERHIKAGTQGFVLGGATGESATLDEKDKEKLLKLGLEVVNGRVPVIMGSGSNDTAKTVKETQKAASLGADGCLVVTPYYNKPTQEGLYQHYVKVASSVSIPILLYNVTSRTACDILPETVERLCKIPNIVGIKECSDLARCKELLQRCGKEFLMLSGDDASSLAFMLQGGHGVISVTANVAPTLMYEMCQAALRGDMHQAGSINTKLMGLHKALFVESNPIPVKWAVQQLGWIDGGIRLPLTPLSDKHQPAVKQAMQQGGVL